MARLAVLMGALAFLGPVSYLAASDCPPSGVLTQAPIDVINTEGVRRINVEIADTAAARAAGLMCRDSVAADGGMLLVYPGPQPARIWMKNTRVPLDIVFIAVDGRVVKIVEQVKPNQTKRIESDQPVIQVLELPAGSAARYGLRVGDAIRRAE